MEASTKVRVMAGSITVVIVAATISFLGQRSANTGLNEALNKEKLTNEILLSEKLVLEKGIIKLKDRIRSLSDKNSQVDKLLKEASSKLERSEADLKKIKRNNQSVEQLKKQNQELVAIRDELQNSVRKLTFTLAELQNEREDMSSRIAFLEQQNQSLQSDLNRAHLAMFDNTQVESLKKNDRLTVSARRTKKLQAAFTIPAGMRDISFRIIDPNGKALSHGKDGLVSFQTKASDVAVASTNAGSAAGVPDQRVEMTYTPKVKLQSGVYKIEILSEKLYVASMQVKLK